MSEFNSQTIYSICCNEDRLLHRTSFSSGMTAHVSNVLNSGIIAGTLVI